MRRFLQASIVLLPALSAPVWLYSIDDPEISVASGLDARIVRVFVATPGGVGSGTGFVVTNYLVVRTHAELAWRLFVVDRHADETRELPAELVRGFPAEDLAVLRVAGLERPAVTFAASNAATPGQGLEVFAMGFPAAADRLGPQDQASLVRGALSRVCDAPWQVDGAAIAIFQHTAPINLGNSGGPLVDWYGRVLGINTQREARVVRGPGGVPLVTDSIQGLFYASSGRVLVAKLQSLNIAYDASGGWCASRASAVLSRPSAAAIAVEGMFLPLAVAGLLHRRCVVVQVVVHCGDVIGACAQAIASAVTRLVTQRQGAVEIAIADDRPSGARGPAENT